MTEELHELIAIAIKAEIESNGSYSRLADQVDNFVLKDKFRYLATEEEGHRQILEKLFRESFPDMELVLPEHSNAPIVNVTLSGENLLSDIMEQAMDAEKAAEEFYKGLAERFEDEERKGLMNYLANIEQGHHYFLNIERQRALRYETYDQEFPMMHIGP